MSEEYDPKAELILDGLRWILPGLSRKDFAESITSFVTNRKLCQKAEWQWGDLPEDRVIELDYDITYYEGEESDKLICDDTIYEIKAEAKWCLAGDPSVMAYIILSYKPLEVYKKIRTKNPQ